MQVEFRTIGVKHVACAQVVDHLQVARRVGDAVAGRVAHLIFGRVLLDVFTPPGQRSLDVVLLGLVPQEQLDTLHIGIEIVARVLEIGTHAKVL